MSSSRNNKYSPPDSDEPWELLIGEIVAPQGLKGEVKVYPHTDFPERFRELQQIGMQLNVKQPIKIVTIQQVRVQERKIVLKLENIDSIDAAEALRGIRLYIPRSWAVELTDGEYYHHQLIGLQVITTDGDILGPIIEIWPTGANDVYETTLAMIPATKEFIREINLTEGRMVVQSIPGLLKADPGD